MELTKKGKEQLHNSHIGVGKAFIHTGEGEITSFEFYLGKNGKWYVKSSSFNPVELCHEFSDMAKELERKVE